MYIQTGSKLTLADVHDAINQARAMEQDIYLEEGWMTPRGRIGFWCNSAHGKYTTGRVGDHGRAATWTAWGYVIAGLFARDPHAVIGPYRSADHFTEMIYDTQQRYYNRRMFGMKERVEEQGQDISFLSLLWER